MDRSISIAKFLQGVFKIQIWFEFVDSKGNWSDGISRLLQDDPFAYQHNFPVSELVPDATFWAEDLEILWHRILAMTP